jgi:hypothetical protein
MSKKTRQRLDVGLKAKVALRRSATRQRLRSWRPNISCTRTRFMPGRSGWLTAREGFFSAQVRTMSRAERLAMVDPAAGRSMRRQCALLGLAHCRSIASRWRRIRFYYYHRPHQPLDYQNPSGGVGGWGEPCGFTAAL